MLCGSALAQTWPKTFDSNGDVAIFGVLAARKKTHKKAYFFVIVVAWRHRIQPPIQAGVGFGLGSGSPVCFLPELGRRGVELRRHQGPTKAPPVENFAWLPVAGGI